MQPQPPIKVPPVAHSSRPPLCRRRCQLIPARSDASPPPHRPGSPSASPPDSRPPLASPAAPASSFACAPPCAWRGSVVTQSPSRFRLAPTPPHFAPHWPGSPSASPTDSPPPPAIPATPASSSACAPPARGAGACVNQSRRLCPRAPVRCGAAESPGAANALLPHPPMQRPHATHGGGLARRHCPRKLQVE